jgi:hypothetical protein
VTKLEAVNIMLRRAGLGETRALSTNGTGAAGQAEQVLDEIDLSVQGESWNYNTRNKVLLSPNGDGNIEAPGYAITVDSDYSDQHRNIINLGGYLYNHTDQTAVFTDGVYVTMRVREDWCYIPHPVQEYIAYRAAREWFISRLPAKLTEAQNVQLRELMAKERDARTRARQFDQGSSDQSILSDARSQQIRGFRPRFSRWGTV